MPVDIFLKIGDVVGESPDAKHKGWSDVLSWSWGLSQPAASHAGGGGGGAGKVSVRDLEVTRRLDKASPLFELAVCEGKHYPDASLSVRKTGAGAVEYLKFSFKDVVITSLAQSANAAEGTVTETITVNFNEFKTDYTAQKADGSVDGVVSAGWNMAQNKPA